MSSIVNRHESSAITDIGNVCNLTDNKNDNSTSTASLDVTCLLITFLVSILKETTFSFLKAILNCLYWIIRETGVPHNHLMELIPKKVSTLGTTMTIIDGKEAAAGPEIYLLKLGLDDIQNDGDTIFIVVSNHTLMCIGSVCYYDAIFLRSKFSRIIICFEFIDLLLLHFHVFLTLAHGHFHTAVLNNVIRS